MTQGWFDANGEWIEPRTLGPLDEILARLRGYRDGPLRAFFEPAARWEQGLNPPDLFARRKRLATELMRLPADRAVVEEAVAGVGVEPARRLLRQVLAEWKKPEGTQQALCPHLQRRSGEILWLLEEVGVGVTGVQVEVSISGILAGEISYQVFWPIPRPNVDESERLDAWWAEWRVPSDVLHFTDDVGTPYRQRVAEYGWCSFPLRVLVNGQWQTRVTERFHFTFAPGVPDAAQSLALSGSIVLTIEQPSGEPHPGPTTEVSLGDFSYTIDLAGWWPRVVKGDEDFR